MKDLVFLLLNALCLLPVLLCLDPWTPGVFLCLAAVWMLVRRPDRWWALLAALAAAFVLAWWVFLSNVIWTVGGNAFERSLLLAYRTWALTGISASFALGVDGPALLREAMQLARLPVRVGFALFTALGTLPRLVAEQKHLGAVHRLRLGGRASGPFVQAVTLLARAIRSGERSALSLAARGLDRPLDRTWYRPVSWTSSDLWWVAGGTFFSVSLFAALVWGGFFVFGFG